MLSKPCIPEPPRWQTLPGIGGVTAGGAATGVQVVISAEWVEAMRYLIAIGAITGVEIAKIAGISSLATSSPPPRPRPPVVPSPGASSAGSAPEPPVRVLVRHRGGNRQVEVGGRRWHLPKGKSPADIPASDPVGDRLQEAVNRIAREWDSGKLSPKEKVAIDKAYSAGKPWRARLFERQARGRWVERQAKNEFRQLRWEGKGVDAVDPTTKIQYEVLSGTKSNMELHGKRMADELFRMITF